MVFKYKWLQGDRVTRSEFKDLLLNHESFFLKMMPKKNRREFKKLTKSAQIRQIIQEKYKKDKWLWAFCCTISATVMLKKASAQKDIYDSLNHKLYHDDSFPYVGKVSTDKYEIALGESRQKFEVTIYEVPFC